MSINVDILSLFSKLERKCLMLITITRELNAPKIDSADQFSVAQIVFSAFIAILAGARSWQEISSFAEIKLPLIQEFMPFNKDIPSPETYYLLARLLPTQELDKIFVALAKDIIEKSQEGQLNTKSNETLNSVVAWYSNLKISLGQLKSDTNSHNIIELPQLLDRLDLKKAEVFIDDMGTTATAIAKAVHQKKGHYLLALTENQEPIINEAQELCEKYEPISFYKNTHTANGQTNARAVEAFKVNKRVVTTKDEWAGLKQILKVSTTKSYETKKEVVEDTHYYLVNSSFEAKHYLHLLNEHGSKQNNCHWQLDFTFYDDKVQQTKQAAATFSRLLKFCMNLVRTVDFGKDNSSSVKIRAFVLSNSDKFLMQLFKSKANES